MTNAEGRYGGVIEISGQVYVSDVNNAPGELVENIEEAQVKWSVDSVIPSQLDLKIRDMDEYFPYSTFFAAYLTVSYMDPSEPGSRITQVDQLGLFSTIPSNKDLLGAEVTQTVSAYDLMWRISQRTAGATVTLAAGTNPIDWIRSRMSLWGFSRHNIVSTTHTLTKEFTWRVGTAYITIFNDLLYSIGYYPLWADRQGYVRSMPIREMSAVQSQAEFTTVLGDIGESVRIEPDQLRIRNDVIIVGNSPGNDPIIARRTNVDLDSPISIYGLRGHNTEEPVYLTYYEEDSSLETQTAANARAMKILEERSSLLIRMGIEVVPRPGLDMHEPIDLFIETDSGFEVADGKWWWDEMTVDFTDSSGAMFLRCNKLQEFDFST